MKIIILGAGQVGSTLAENLVEDNDITVVDIDDDKLRTLQDRLDLRTVTGSASHPSVLADAGAREADMIVAVTQSDETNMLACKIAAHLFNVHTKIARIRTADYVKHPTLFSPEQLAVDFIISPEQEVTNYLVRLIEHPGSLQVWDFAHGKVRLVAVRTRHGGPLVGHELQDLHRHMPHIDARVAAIFRHDQPLTPEGKTRIEVGDEVFFIAAARNIGNVLRELTLVERPVRSVMIAGGGNIGRRLAQAIEDRYLVKLIDHNKRNSEQLARMLNNTLVLIGEATDENLLREENIEETDVFCALTNDDEDNIMAALLAKRLGARRVIALIKRASYVDLVQRTPIDIAISPAQATVSPLLAHIHRGDLAVVHSLRRGAAEALEVVVHGDAASSPLIDRPIGQIDLPHGVTIGAIVRGEKVLIAHHDTVIQAEDHLIVFVVDKRIVPKLEKLLQAGR